jgi:hypothetical protein
MTAEIYIMKELNRYKKGTKTIPLIDRYQLYLDA